MSTPADPTADRTEPTATDSTERLEVHVWADLVCPWCYIAAHRLDAAIAAYEQPSTVVVRHRAFELEPGMPRDVRVPVADYLGEKYGGGRAAGVAMTERVAGVAAEDGLQLDFARAVKTSTFDAHRLVALADDLGGWQLARAAIERFYAAHFQEGVALADHGMLVRLAAEAGLDERRVAEVLESDDERDVGGYAAAVRDDEAQARAMGVSSVPFAVAGGRLGVSGAQPVEVYVELLRRAAAGG